MFRRRREPSVQTLPEYFDSIEEDDSEGGFWNLDEPLKGFERKHCRSESEIYANVCKVPFKNSIPTKLQSLTGSGCPQNRHSTSTLLKFVPDYEIIDGASSNGFRAVQRSDTRNLSRGDKPGNSRREKGPRCNSPKLAERSNVGLPYSTFYMRT